VARGVDVRDRLLGHPVLLLARIEDLRAVDGANEIFAKVGSVDLEEVLEQLTIREPRRIEDDFDRLGVTLRVILGRVVALATGPSHTR
jgi:hypothetical protein